MQKKTFIVTCIECPQGCTVEVKKCGTEYEVSGNNCNKGEEYAIQEITNPMRTITTTVKTVFKDFPRLPVKTDREVPLKDIFLFMKEINTVTVQERLHPGDIVQRGLRETDVNLVATNDMSPRTD
jgi:CxxC motif-containing protein